MGTLDGHIALVTGCGRQIGIGRSIALALARAGADVAVTDVLIEGTRNAGESVAPPADSSEWRGIDSVVDEVRQIGRRAVAIVGDVGREEDAERMVAETIDALGKVDILVNNAGAPHGPDRNDSWKVPLSAFEHVMRINTTGVFLLSTAVARHLLDRGAGGRIINISSGAGLRGYARRAAYCASKFAVNGMTESMALELAPHGITVNAIAPGTIATARQFSRESRADEGAVPPAAPVGRLGTPDDIARAAVFLAEPAGSYITGHVLVVDGGIGI